MQSVDTIFFLSILVNTIAEHIINKKAK